MIPSKLDIAFWRGATFNLNLIGQTKVYVYNPVTHNKIADLKRSHIENLNHYGFSYEYVDFATNYTEASLRIMKPWVKAGQAATQPLMLLSSADGGGITLSADGINIIVSAEDTKAIEFDSGNYELLLTKEDGSIDILVQGSVTVGGDK